VDTVLGPEMKSTGEVMGIDRTFGLAFAKSQLAAGQDLPRRGTAFLSIKDADKRAILPVAKRLNEAGFHIIATRGTTSYLNEHGVVSDMVFKVSEGRPHVVDRIKNGEIDLVINTPSGKRTRSDAYLIRRTTLEYEIPYFTTVAGARAAAEAIVALQTQALEVRPLQEHYGHQVDELRPLSSPGTRSDKRIHGQ
jgi:carbamoyl-phosphate synthase large subunit